MRYDFTRILGRALINAPILYPVAAPTALCGQGPVMPGQALASLGGLLRPWLPAFRHPVLAGCTPQEVPIQICAAENRTAPAPVVKAFFDAEGDALREGVGPEPNLRKPNVGEAEWFLERRLRDRGARERVQPGVEAVAISIGWGDAPHACQRHAWRAQPRSVARRSAEGAGDARVRPATDRACGHGIEMAIGWKLGAATSPASTASPRTALGMREEVEALLPSVVVGEIS